MLIVLTENLKKKLYIITSYWVVFIMVLYRKTTAANIKLICHKTEMSMGEAHVRLWSPKLLLSAMLNLDNPPEWHPLRP